MYSSRTCNTDSIYQIRDFLVNTFRRFPEKTNWLIDRLNFSFSVSRVFNAVSEAEYCSRIRIWEKDGEICSVVNAEGENRGEAFFQLNTLEPERALLQEMFEFTESHLMVKKDDKQVVYLAISKKADTIVTMAMERGYEKEAWSEITCKKDIGERNDIVLPEGYQIKTALETTPEARAAAHSFAFGYNDRNDTVMRSVEAFNELQKMKDYRRELDIQVTDSNGMVAAFATMWFDAANGIGILEPVGTHPKQRRMGLAKAAILHAENLISDLGGTHIYVGSDQEFYKQIGFYECSEDYIYKLER
ncbi:MAG TPA: GNAT family N-acetyltransferase [Thermotogota bacterium]|nr:GNAT family N-acetyltransferase [Thermotogota bacterium]HPJ88730.1 GNAT family N-acetyltransferase [Thermotogota bacterium]HPR97188.1 GNAT family N-acetyltransferase [Thermotogota bacterium]